MSELTNVKARALLSLVTREFRAGAPKFASGPDKEFLGKQCIFAVEDVEEAIARAENASIPGSVVNVTDLLAGEALMWWAHIYQLLYLECGVFS